MLRLQRCATLSIVFLFALTGCESLSETKLKYHDEYYVHQPGRHCFEYERQFKDGSSIRGTLDYQIKTVDWGNTSSDKNYSYLMKGVMKHTAKGIAKSVDVAFEIVPMEEQMAAMAPDNVAEVFVKVPLPKGTSGDGTAYEVHKERLRSLKLPLEFQLETKELPFSSGLYGRAREWAAEVGMVWFKNILFHLNIMQLFFGGGSMAVTAIQETPDQAIVVFRQEANGKVDMFTATFQRGRSLVEIKGDLADGSKLTLKLKGL